MGYVNSIIYVMMNTVISLTVALPAAYAFSRYHFMGDKHLFFWLLTNRMAPPAVFACRSCSSIASVGPVRHPHRGGAGALPVQRAAGGLDPGRVHARGAEGDRRDRLSGRLFSFGRFFTKIFMPLIASGHRRDGVLLLHVLVGRTAAARTLTTTDAKPIAATMTRTIGASGVDWGVLAAAGVLTIVPGALVIYFVRNYIAKGFALGACVDAGGIGTMDWMAWTVPTAIFFGVIASLLDRVHDPGDQIPETPRTGILWIETTRGDRLFITLLGSAFINLAWLGLEVGPQPYRAAGLPCLCRWRSSAGCRGRSDLAGS